MRQTISVWLLPPCHTGAQQALKKYHLLKLAVELCIVYQTWKNGLKNARLAIPANTQPTNKKPAKLRLSRSGLILLVGRPNKVHYTTSNGCSRVPNYKGVMAMYSYSKSSKDAHSVCHIALKELSPKQYKWGRFV